MRIRTILVVLAVTLAAAPSAARSQSFPTDDEVIRAMWEEGVVRTQTPSLAQALMDSIGPRLAGSPEFDSAGEWLLALYESWGVEARREVSNA